MMASPFLAFYTVVILSERSESKDPDNAQVLIAVESFLSMLFVRKPESAFPSNYILGVLRLALRRFAPSYFAQDDRWRGTETQS